MKNNKKGISAVVATVLIILITIAAVTIIWTAIMPMLGGQLDAGTACLEADRAFEIVSGSHTCHAAASEVQIRRLSSDDNLVGGNVYFTSTSGNTVCEATVDLGVVGAGEMQTYPCGQDTETATVYATVNIGDTGETKECAAVTVTLPAC